MKKKVRYIAGLAELIPAAAGAMAAAPAQAAPAKVVRTPQREAGELYACFKTLSFVDFSGLTAKQVGLPRC